MLAILQQGFEHLVELGLRLSANQFVNHLTILEEQDGRDVTNTKLSCQILTLLNIALSNGDATIVLFSQF